jgi:CheY-like chemotaxis protein
MTNETTPVVLVADDEPSMLALVARHITTMGYQVYEASDGEQAWQLAREHLPDLVLLDVMMPKMNGFDVLRALKGDPGVSDIPVIMLTNLEQPADIKRAADGGAHSYLVKSNMNLDELAAKIAGALANRTCP